MSETENTFSLEAKLREIRELMNKLQMDTHDFDENVKMFQQGTSLIAECRTYLDEAELSIHKLVGGEEEEMEIE